MAFAMTAALLAFAVGCDENGDSLNDNIDIRVSVREIECYSEAATFDVGVSVKNAEWYYVKDDIFTWISVGYSDHGLQISISPIPQNNNGKKLSRTGLVEIKAFDAESVTTLPIVIRQYADEDIPDDGPIHFYDVVFEKFLLKKYDKDRNGKLSPLEAFAVTHLDCSNLGIASLSGIEYFRNLISLDCSGNCIKSLDVSSNLNLEKLDCSNNFLSELILLDESQVIDDLKLDDGVKIVYKNNKYVIFGNAGCTDELLLVDSHGYIGSYYSSCVTYEMYTNAESWKIVPDYSQCADPNIDWINIWPSSGHGDGRFSITVSANVDQGDARSANINIISNDKILKTIRVEQSALEK